MKISPQMALHLETYADRIGRGIEWFGWVLIAGIIIIGWAVVA